MSVCISDNELNELTYKVEFMLSQLKNVVLFINKLHEMADDGAFDTKNGMSLLDVKFHLLIMYCSKLCIYISMRGKGESVANHKLLNQLAICSWILDKLRCIQKQCQYSIDKLLEHSKKAFLIINDELSHKPDLDLLRPPIANINSKTDINNKTNIDNKYGIYRPLKLNPILMDTQQNILSGKQQRIVKQFKRKVKNSEIYNGIKDSMTNLPKEENFFLENVDKFSVNKSKSKTKKFEYYEENNYVRLKQTRNEFKKAQNKKRYKESLIGQNLNSFIDNLDKSYTNTQRLADFEAGAKFIHTIGKHTKNTKNTQNTKKYIKGSWQKRQRILFKHSKKGKKIESRKKWRKQHPFKTNPANAARIKHHRFKKSSKVKRLLKKIT